MNIDYTLWPNTDGNLGNIKVQIPTGIGDDKWPEGDALIGNFVYKDGKLVGFVDTKALTVNDSKSTTFPYDYVNITIDKSLEGTMTFNKGERTKYLFISYFTPAGNKYADVASIIDNILYDTANNVIGTLDTAAIVNGDSMFKNCSKLAAFASDLSSLESGVDMFYGCKISYGTLTQRIVPSLPTYTDGLIHELAITIDSSEWLAAEELPANDDITLISNATRAIPKPPTPAASPFYGMTIPYYKTGESLSFSTKGWIIHLTTLHEEGTYIGSYISID